MTVTHKKVNPLKRVFAESLGAKVVTSHGASGSREHLQWPEDNIVCKAWGHVYSRKSKEGSGYDGSTHCFRCGFDNWTDPWT